MNADVRNKALARAVSIATRLLLQGGGQLDANELSREFNVSLRTLRRDVANMGAPFFYKHDKILLDMQGGAEMADSALAIAYIKSIAQNSGEAMRAAIYALLKRLEASSGGSEAFFTRNSVEEIELDLHVLQILQDSIKQGFCVEFIFPKNAPKHAKPRLVQPLKIIAFEGQWYLLGEEKQAQAEKPNAQSCPHTNDCNSKDSQSVESTHCNNATSTTKKTLSSKAESSADSTPPKSSKPTKLDPKSRGIMKKFYLNNIARVTKAARGRLIEKEEFKRLDSALNAWFVPDGERIEVVLWVDSKVAKYFKRRKLSPHQHLRECKDGSLEITLGVTDFMEISGEILRWIPYVFVLEPHELKDFVRQKIEKYQALLDS